MDTENPPLVLPNGYVYSTKVRTRWTALLVPATSNFISSNTYSKPVT
jgi:hypothetical protein